jgi:tetratricopeptide (TPR) repeat protein
MIQHGHIDEVLLDFLYGELGEGETREVERHLAACERCAGEVAKFREVRAAMARVPQAEVRPEISEVLRRRARELAPQPQRFSLLSFLMRPSVAGVFLFVLVLGVGLYFVRSGEDAGPREEVPSVERFAASPAAPAADPAPRAAAAPAVPAATPASPAPAPAAGAAVARAEDAPPPAAPPRARTRKAREPRIVAKVARPTPESLFPKKEVGAEALAAAPKAPEARAREKDAVGGVGGKAMEAEGLALGYTRGASKGATVGAPPPKQAPAPAEDRPQIVARASRPAVVAEEPKLREEAREAPAQAMSPGAPSAPQQVVPARQLLDEASRDARDGRFDQALQKLSNAATAGGREAAQALLAIAEIQFRQGEFARAAATLERLLRTNPGYATPRAYELLAMSYERRGDTRRAGELRSEARRRFQPPATSTGAPARSKAKRAPAALEAK